LKSKEEEKKVIQPHTNLSGALTKEDAVKERINIKIK